MIPGEKEDTNLRILKLAEKRYQDKLWSLADRPGTTDTDPEYKSASGELHRVRSLMSEYEGLHRETDETGKLTAAPVTRSPAENKAGKGSAVFHFEPSVTEVQRILREKPELIGQLGIDKSWLNSTSVPKVSMPFVDPQTMANIGVNIQPLKTHLDTITTESSPYAAVAGHLWDERLKEAQAKGENLKRYRDVKLRRGEVDDYVVGGLEHIIERRLAPAALGLADSYSGGSASPMWDQLKQRYKNDQPIAPEHQKVTDPLSGWAMGTDDTQVGTVDLPSSQDIKDRSPGFYHAANIAGYAGKLNPTNILQEGIQQAGKYGARKWLGKTLVSAAAGGVVGGVEGGFRDYAESMGRGESRVEAADNVIENALPNIGWGAGTAVLGDQLAQGAGALRASYRAGNKDLRTIADAGGDTRFFSGYKAPEGVQSYVDKNLGPRGEGSPGAQAAEEVAPHIQKSLDDQDRALQTRIASTKAEYFRHPVYGRLKASTKSLVDALVDMAGNDRFQAPVTGKSSVMDPDIVRTINSELRTPWAEPIFVSDAEAPRVAHEVGGTIVPLDVANDMFGVGLDRPRGDVAVIKPAQITAQQLTTLEEHIDRKLKSYTESKAPADPVYIRLNQAVKELRDKSFPYWEDEAGNLVDPPPSVRPSAPFNPSGDLPPAGNGELRVLPKPRPVGESGLSREAEPGIGPGQPDLPSGPFDQRAPRRNTAQAIDPSAPIDVGGSGEGPRPEGLMGVGPGRPALPDTFDPRARRSAAGAIDPSAPVDVGGGEPRRPEGLMGVGPGQPHLPDTFDPRMGRQTGERVSPERGVDIGGSGPAQSQELMGAGPGQPDLPSNPFDPRLPVSREYASVQPTIDVRGEYGPPQDIQPEALPGVGPRRDPRDNGRPLESGPRQDVQGDYYEPQEIPPEALPGAGPRRDPRDYGPPVAGEPRRDVRGDYNEPAAIEPDEPAPRTPRMPSGIVAAEDSPLSLLAGNKLAITDAAVREPTERIPPRKKGEPQKFEFPANMTLAQYEAMGGKTGVELPPEIQARVDDGTLTNESQQRQILDKTAPVGDQRSPLERSLDDQLGQPEIREQTEPTRIRDDVPPGKEEEWYENIVAPGRDARSGEAKRAGDLAVQREAYDAVEGDIRKMEDTFGKFDEAPRLQSVLNMLSKRLGREVTKEDLVRAGIISAGVAASLSDDEDVQRIGRGALTVGGLAMAAGRGGKPTQPKATLDNGKEVEGFSAVQRRHHEQMSQLEQARQRTGAGNDKTIRDRLINFKQDDDDIFDKALKAEAEKLGLTEKLFRVPAAAAYERLKNSSRGGTKGSGFLARATDTIAPRVDRLLGVAAGVERNPFMSRPDTKWESIRRAAIADPGRQFFNMSAGRTGARYGDDARDAWRYLFDEEEENK